MNITRPFSKNRTMSKWLLLSTAVILGTISYAPCNPFLPDTGIATAAETDTMAARKAQLEGTQLQLKGDIQGAVEKYKESLSYSPNERLEKLVQKLEARIEPPAPAPQNSTTEQETALPAAASQLEQQQKAIEPGAIEDIQKQQMSEAMPQPAEKELIGQAAEATIDSVPTKQLLDSPQEQLIDDFLQWILAFIPAPTADGMGIILNKEYTIQQKQEYYQVSFSPVKIAGPEGFEVTVSSLDFQFVPHENGRLDLTMSLPDQIPFLEAGTQVGSMSIGEQNIHAVWDKAKKNFTQSDVSLGQISLTDLEEKIKITIQQAGLDAFFSTDAENHWKLNYSGELNTLALVADDGGMSIQRIHLDHSQAGSDADKITEIQNNLMQIIQRGDQASLEDLQAYFANLDVIFQNLDAYNTNVRVEGIEAHGDEFQVGIGALYGKSDLSKQQGSTIFNYQGLGGLEDISFSQPITEEQQHPISGSLKNIQLVTGGVMETPPPNLFGNLLLETKKLEATPIEERDKAMIPVVMDFLKEALKLFKGYSTEISLAGFTLENATPTPITCGKISLSSGFEVGSGKGGAVTSTFNLSEFQGPNIGTSSLPQDANLNLQLSNIPNLLQLFPEPKTLAEGDKSMIESEFMLKGQSLLMNTPLVLSITDTYLTFPTAKLSLGLSANLDSAAKFFSTGNLNMSVENPEEFTKILQALGNNGDVAQVMATFTALANRTETDGKIVDTINAQVDPAGKIFVNAKDVTSMFFPPSEGQAQ
ncbi:hypothetical protein [Desulfogranum japonicum]|uniref:hypothetical protein n=1 Tax=Desulfogranum japonicum TaxID=231447 RepID=UPI00048B9C92|nr:hypothetical protein [Desulfogranum japonicum]